ncbi:MAG: adenylate/guanylate cyclase domain-containing protein [Reyranella sp.]|nr:adenylate/guanylate cyclase domain-containing protein [Reyranella sp.]
MPERGQPVGLGGSRSNEALERRLSAVSFLDIVGFATLMAEDAPRTHQAWMRVLHEIILPAAQGHHGRIVKSTGDGVLAEFSSAREAVAWARAVQDALLQMQAGGGLEVDPIAARIAVHIDEVFAVADDIYGPGVNIAARLQEYAEPGGIVLSQAAFGLVRDSLDRPTRDLGLLYLKNIPDPVAAHALDPIEQPLVRHFRHAATLPSIAVLPLQNLGGDPAEAYFAEGIVEDIVVSLASLRELLVIARGSSLTLSRNETDLRSVGRMLGVRYVMTGNVRRTAKRLRVAVRLIDAESGVSLWGDVAEGATDELFEMQDRIVGRVVTGIAPHVRSAELQRALRKRPGNFTAYDSTLQALDCIHSLEKTTFFRAREHLDRAMAEDRNFAMPVAWAARWRSLLIGQSWSDDPRRDTEAAAELAAKAIELDGQNALALATFGHVRSFLFHDYDVALGYFDRALSACPNSPVAWFLSSGTLSYVGRAAEAVRHAEQALRLSPFDQSLFAFYMFLGMAHYCNGNYEEAVKAGRRSLSERPAYTANLRVLSAALSALDRQDEAAEIGKRLLALEPTFTVTAYERTRMPFRDTALRTLYKEHLLKVGLPV